MYDNLKFQKLSSVLVYEEEHEDPLPQRACGWCEQVKKPFISPRRHSSELSVRRTAHNRYFVEVMTLTC